MMRQKNSEDLFDEKDGIIRGDILHLIIEVLPLSHSHKSLSEIAFD
jgi:hypothetical protein